MIQANNLIKSFGNRELFSDVSFTINPREKVGLVGRNGSGKSTLVKIIQNEIHPDGGEISIPKNYSIGYLKQQINLTEPTLIAECSKSLEYEYDSYKAEKILFGLGFEKDDLDKNPKEFSGGFQLRIELAKVLIEDPNLLLLDEPTNYLDILSIRWLKKFLASFKGEVILISHDSGFMDEVVGSVMGINRKKLKKIKGSTSNYYEQLKFDDEIHEKTRVNQEKKVKQMEEFVNKFRAKARQASMAQSRMKMIDKLDINEKLDSEKSLQFEFNYKECPAKFILEAKDVSFGYKSDDLLFSHLSFSLKRNARIAVVGPNGKGKSTLLNLISGQLKPSSGKLDSHHGLSIGHFTQTNIQSLHPKNTILQEVISVNPQLESLRVRGICGTMMFSNDDVNKKIEVLSGGEKARVLIAKILAKQNNLLLLDEPTCHLDQESIQGLCLGIEKFKGAVIIVTHDEKLVSRIAENLIFFQAGTGEYYEGNYSEFLERVGWDEVEPSKQKSKPKLSKKEAKRLRSELLSEKSKALNPLKAEIAKIEQRILNNEEKQKEVNQLLIDASQANNAAEIVKLSKTQKQLESDLDHDYSKLQEVTEKHDVQLEQFESKLTKLSM